MARTPFGKLGGGLAPLNATTLGAVALAGAIERAKIDPTRNRARHLRRSAASRRRPESRAPGRSSKPVWPRPSPPTRSTKCARRDCLRSSTRCASINAGAQRRGGRRRHGVDVERAVSAARRALGLSLRRRRARRRDDLRRTVGSVFSDDDGDAGKQGRARAGDDARRARSLRAREPSPHAPRRTRPGNFADEIVPVQRRDQSQGQGRRRRAAAARPSARSGCGRRCAAAAYGITSPPPQFTLDYANVRAVRRPAT